VRAIRGGWGDDYAEGHRGARYYFYAPLLTLQGGDPLAEMTAVARHGGAYSGVGATLGLRIGW
jgi:hypothetical protein